ncbi:MAG: type III-B CRISPR module RAMP protein Cmr4 [Calditrichaeota bacterium]|nr:type III-B CRISPR module RAMP protein Cmr4 [Calditrichota bacterium]
MYKKAMAMFMLCETSVHAGSGSELGIVDLPIQRERHTDYPVFHSSSIKGALRFNVDRATAFWEAFKKQLKNDENILLSKVLDSSSFVNIFEAVFGEKQVSNEKESFAAAIAITDGRILLFPVKSLKGTFAYITCSFVINRLKRDLTKAGIDLNNIPEKLDVKEGNAFVCKGSSVVVNNALTLEEFTFHAEEKEEVTLLAEELAMSLLPNDSVYDYLKNKIKNSLVVLSDDDFKEFVSQSTEVVARIKIDEKTGTVSSEGGNLWYEENLPAETILYSLIFAQDLNEGGKKKANLENNSVSAETVLTFIRQVIPERIQLGGNETIGRGILALKFYNGN